jgi:very-short-patch-repair endonuclease
LDLIPYNPRLKAFARDLRCKSTLAEVLLWRQLKGRQRLGFDFHRQKPILERIADFYSAELKLAVEIDGDSHRARPEQDRAKEHSLRALGIDLLRFGDTETKRGAEGVAWQIDDWIRRKRSELLMAKARSNQHTPACGQPSL